MAQISRAQPWLVLLLVSGLAALAPSLSAPDVHANAVMTRTAHAGLASGHAAEITIDLYRAALRD